MIICLGVITSFEDFLSSKIKNKWILVGLLYTFIVYSLSWILYGLTVRKIVGPLIGGTSSYLIWNFDKWCINLIVSTIVAYLLWHFKMWAAGDAKLFICYSSLIPMGQYSKVYFNYYFASFLLLLAIFLPATVYLFLRAVIYFLKSSGLAEFRQRLLKLIKEKINKFNKIEMSKVLLGFFVLFLSFRILQEELQNLASKILPNQNILILISLLAFKPLSKVFKKSPGFMSIAFIILIFYAGFKIAYFKEQFVFYIGNTFARTIFIMILFPLSKKIVEFYSERTLQKNMPFAPWMFLGALIAWFI